jgi:integrase
VDAKEAGDGFGLLVLVLAYTGLRWGELAGLRVRDLDFRRGRLEVSSTMIEVNGYMDESTPKDYEARSIPVPAFVLSQLAEHVEREQAPERLHLRQLEDRSGSSQPHLPPRLVRRCRGENRRPRPHTP